MSQIHIPKKQRPAPVSAPARAPERRSGGALPTAQDQGKRIQLDSAIQDKMERAFGADFSTVELYESPAVEATGAQAVTMGNRIGFAPDKTDFQSPQGQRLLGHELSHVVGQARGMVEGTGFLHHSGLEQLADRQGAMAAGGQTIPASSLQPLSASTIAAASGPMQAKKEPKTEEEKRELELREQAEKQEERQKALRENAAHFVKTSEDLMQTGKDMPLAYTMWDRAEQMQNLVRQSRADQQSLVDEANGVKSQRLAKKSENWYAKASQSRKAGQNASGALKYFRRAQYSMEATGQRFMGWATGLRSKTAVKDGIGNKVKILLPELGNQLEQWVDQKLQQSEWGQEFLKKGLVGTVRKMMEPNPEGGPIRRFLRKKLSPIRRFLGKKFGPAQNSHSKKLSPVRNFFNKAFSPVGDYFSKKFSSIKSSMSKKLSPIVAGFLDRHEKAVANFVSPEGQAAWAKMSDMNKFLYKLKNPLAYLDAKTKGGRSRALSRVKQEQEAASLAEDMHTMDPGSFQTNTLTDEQRATDMQNLFDEEKSMKQTGLYLTGDQRLVQQNGQDMRRLFDDSYQENDLAYAPGSQEDAVASFAANRVSGSQLLKPVKAVSNVLRSDQIDEAGVSIMQKGSALENETSRNAVRVLRNFLHDNAEVRERRGLEHTTGIFGKLLSKIGIPLTSLASLGINKVAIDAEGTQKEHRRRVVKESTNYDEQFAYTLSQLDSKGKWDTMSDVEKDRLRRQAKHTALASIYGQGVETFQQAEAIELQKRITKLRHQAQADPELMKLLVSELNIQSDFSDWDTKLPYWLNADYQQDETTDMHRQVLANKRYEKKNGLQATVAKSKAGGLSFMETVKKVLKRGL